MTDGPLPRPSRSSKEHHKSCKGGIGIHRLVFYFDFKDESKKECARGALLITPLYKNSRPNQMPYSPKNLSALYSEATMLAGQAPSNDALEKWRSESQMLSEISNQSTK